MDRGGGCLLGILEEAGGMGGCGGRVGELYPSCMIRGKEQADLWTSLGPVV